MRRYFRLIYFVVMAVLILSLSGCGGSSGGGSSSQTDKLMVVSSPVLQKGESYTLYRGNNVGVRASDADYNPTYYVAPVAGSETVTMNLEFAESLSEDQPFVIAHQDADGSKNVVFYYNPNGNGQTDLTTAYGEVMRYGGGSQQLRYSGLTVTGAAIDLDTSDEVVIVLNGSTASIQGGTSVPSYNYVWHSDPDHRDEYYTLGESTNELTEEEMLENITANEGVYINRDIRYMPNTLNFTGTAKNDEETEYAAYYSEAVQSEIAAELGTGFEGPYIFATLPQTMGQGGGMPGQQGDPGTFTDPRMRPVGDNPSTIYGAVSNSDISAFSTMTHSAEDAYNNPVLHIVESGTYRLTGTWNGQIWIEVGEDVDDKVALILDGVSVTCGVAPALVFREVYECGPSEEGLVSFDVAENLLSTSGANAGAIVVIADGTTNSFTGANVYRMLKPEPKKNATVINGTDTDQQKKRYKMDGAFYSFMSMVIGAENNSGSGRLNITSTTYEGLNTERHLLIDSGIITVSAQDDGINVNEDNISTFVMNGGTLTVSTPGGDGIDSNGYVVINDGTVDISCAQDSNELNAVGDGPIDSVLGVYMSSRVNYSHRAYSQSGSTQPGGNTNTDTNTETDTNTNTDTTTTTSRTPIELTDSDGNSIMSIRYSNPVRDTEGSSRGIATSGEVFTLSHSVNSFSGITTKQ